MQAPQQGSTLTEGIRLKEERLPNSRVRVSVEVPATNVRWCYDRVLQSSRKNLEIPGFRKGKKVRGCGAVSTPQENTWISST